MRMDFMIKAWKSDHEISIISYLMDDGNRYIIIMQLLLVIWTRNNNTILRRSRGAKTRFANCQNRDGVRLHNILSSYLYYI